MKLEISKEENMLLFKFLVGECAPGDHETFYFDASKEVMIAVSCTKPFLAWVEGFEDQVWDSSETLFPIRFRLESGAKTLAVSVKVRARAATEVSVGVGREVATLNFKPDGPKLRRVK